MTKIKICGLKRVEDINYANEVKPDYIGFVFAGAKRKIDFDTAAKLKKLLNKDIKAVGVFVNETLDNIARLCDEGTIDLVQLHGDEDEEYIYRLKDRIKNKVIKAFKVKGPVRAFDTKADFIMFDAYSPKEYGGTGKTFSRDFVKGYKKPFFAAGGLNVGNLEDTIRELAPYCVDISSGVETNGLKDLGKMKEAVNIVRGIKK